MYNQTYTDRDELIGEMLIMNNRHDLGLMIKSHVPIIVIKSHEEQRVLELLKDVVCGLDKPTFKWTVTEGLLRLGGAYKP